MGVSLVLVEIYHFWREPPHITKQGFIHPGSTLGDRLDTFRLTRVPSVQMPASSSAAGEVPPPRPNKKTPLFGLFVQLSQLEAKRTRQLACFRVCWSLYSCLNKSYPKAGKRLDVACLRRAHFKKDDISLPECMGQTKSKLAIYHQNYLPTKFKVQELKK